jgi:hypothetical protein
MLDMGLELRSERIVGDHFSKSREDLQRGHAPDRTVGDQKFKDVSNEVFQVLMGDSNPALTASQINDLLNAIEALCKQQQPKLELNIIRTSSGGGGGGGGGGGDDGGGGFGGGYPLSPYLTGHLNRFGEYRFDVNRQPPPIDYRLPILGL